MKVMRILILSASLWILAATGTRADLVLQFDLADDNVQLIFDTLTGTNYQVQISTNLSNWDDLETVIPGDGLSKTQEVSTTGYRTAFFRLLATQTSADTAPSDTEFTGLVVGKTVLGYSFLNATQFNWFGELGNWDYTKTDITTGKLVFTYDEDGNNPAIYREEIILTFDTATAGTYHYSEFNFGVEDSASVSTGPFDLSDP